MKNMENMKKLKCLFPLLLFLLNVIATVNPVYAGDVNQTWFFRSDFKLSTENSQYSSYVCIKKYHSAYGYVGYLGFRVYIDNTELTNGVSAIVSRTSGEGFQTVSLQISEASLTFRFSKVKVYVYMKLSTDPWQVKAIFESETLQFARLKGSWTFKVYTRIVCVYIPEIDVWETTFYFYFGSSTYNSRIEGVVLTEPTVYDWMFYNLRIGNFVGFIVYPYVNLIGSMFYGLMTLLICLPLYIRYRNIAVILFVVTLLGGAGGVISLLIPESGLQLAWLIFVLGLAGLLYKVFR